MFYLHMRYICTDVVFLQPHLSKPNELLRSEAARPLSLLERSPLLRSSVHQQRVTKRF
jgi:hypothetical protein